jgi:hypothetical protein
MRLSRRSVDSRVRASSVLPRPKTDLLLKDLYQPRKQTKLAQKTKEQEKRSSMGTRTIQAPCKGENEWKRQSSVSIEERRQTLRLYKRGRVWWFSLEFQGKRHQKTTKEKNRVKAEGIASAYRTKLAEGRVGIIERKPAPALSDAMKAFLDWSKSEHREHPATYQRYKTSSKPLLVYLKFKGKPIDEITPATIEEYKAHRGRQSGKKTKRLIKPATINCELACLKAMYFHALKDRHDWEPVSEVEFLPENNEQDRVITFDEQQKYLNWPATL